MPHALLVDDHRGTLIALETLVQREGFSTATASSVAQARARLADRAADVLLLDLSLPDGDGMSLLDDLGAPGAPAVILVTGQGSLDSAIEALRRGVLDYLTKPVDLGRLRALLADITRTRGLQDEIGKLKAHVPERGGLGQLVGTSRPMEALYSLLCRVAPTNATVLVVGESGVGKEVVARTIHDLSRRRHGEFVAVNCGAISPSLMESELFGHERGSFTGADRRHKGYFERAAHGTLLLDEITEMPVTLQVKLLRALETHSFTRVGGEAVVCADVRVIAATNRHPEEAVRRGTLREDLYYRLKVFQVYVPPLRDRTDDIERLAAYFLHEIEATEGAVKRLTPAATDRLRAYHWPGNVRELRNVVYSAYILAHDEITPTSLPPEVMDRHAASSVFDGTSIYVAVGMTVSEVERRLILATLSHCGGSKMKAATMLGLSLKTLYNRLDKYGAREDTGKRGPARPLDDR